MPQGITVDQGYGKRLLDRIEEQPPARKSRNPFCIHHLNQRTQPRVNQLIRSAQLDFTTRAIGAACEMPTHKPCKSSFRNHFSKRRGIRLISPAS
jgi:hypothetical protein